MKKYLKKSWVDPDDVPELDTTFFQEADLYHGETLIRRGLPTGSGGDQGGVSDPYDADD